MSLFRSGRRRNSTPITVKPMLALEALEERMLLSTAPGYVQPSYILNHPAGTFAPLATAGPTGYSPTQIRHAYGFDQISLPAGATADGSGTTIAIVDAYDDPNITNDLHQFDVQFQLPDPVFTKVNQAGGTAYPAANGGWSSEIALDVEWAHAIAPRANLLLVEATDSTFTNLLTAVNYASRQSGVVAVSMSWGGSEGSYETYYDSHFITPTGHGGVTFIASSGDTGAPPIYPSVSPNVLSVGGTTLNLDISGNRLAESGWSGSGGGISSFEMEPSYQRGVVTQSLIYRTTPDVAYDADPYTGFPVYDSYNNGTAAPWSQFGGTSDAAPQWAALVAIADQGRALAGKAPLDGVTQTLPMLYQFAAGDFTDITSGLSQGTPGYSGGIGYDLVSGRGTPAANRLVADLIGTPLSTVTHFGITAPSSSTAGAAFNVTVSALDASNHPVTGYTGTVHLASSDGSALLPSNYTFAAGENGTHTFTNAVTLKKAGSDTLTVSDAVNSTWTGSATVTVAAASPNHLAFGQQPSNTGAGQTISPAVSVQVLDAYNNFVTSDNTDTVSVRLGTNPTSASLSGTLTVTVQGGVATFSNLAVSKGGTGYTLLASSGTLTGVPSNPFNISATPTHLAFVQQPSNAIVGALMSPAVTVEVLDANNNLVTSDNSDQITLALLSNPGGGTLSGSGPVTVTGGVATFSSLVISKAGSGYTLQATSGTLTAATSNPFNITAGSTVLEDFESGLGLYTRTVPSIYATTGTYAAHDGNYGLFLVYNQGWIYRKDAAAQVQQGETLSTWVQLANNVMGRVSFGFGASATGTLSLVLSNATNQLLVDDNNGYGTVDLAAASQSYVINHWYRLEVAWGVGGTITGRLYDSNGTTLLNTVQATDSRVTAGGIAFRSTGAAFFDTVTMNATGGAAALPHTNAPAGTTGHLLGTIALAQAFSAFLTSGAMLLPHSAVSLGTAAPVPLLPALQLPGGSAFRTAALAADAWFARVGEGDAGPLANLQGILEADTVFATQV